MTYSACDLVADVEGLLGDAGYEFNDHAVEGPLLDDSGGWSWTFADAYTTHGRFSEVPAADMSALRDYSSRAEDIKRAAARVLSRWERGDLAQAMRGLRAALDSAVAIDVDEYIKQHGEE